MFPFSPVPVLNITLWVWRSLFCSFMFSQYTTISRTPQFIQDHPWVGIHKQYGKTTGHWPWPTYPVYKGMYSKFWWQPQSRRLTQLSGIWPNGPSVLISAHCRSLAILSATVSRRNWKYSPIKRCYTIYIWYYPRGRNYLVSKHVIHMAKKFGLSHRAPFSIWNIPSGRMT